MTHGRGTVYVAGILEGEEGGTGRRGIKGRKKWDNCNSIINKI